MKRSLILGAAAVAAALALAACGGGSDNTSSAAAPAGSAATVSTEQMGDAGTVLVDAAGKALYAADQEAAAGKVLCTGACTQFWTPLTVNGAPSGAGSLAGELGVVERPDGTRQVTYDGKLLYSFVQDGPGEVTGDGFEDAFGGQTLTWHVVHPSGGTGSAGGSSTTGGGARSTGPYGY